MIFLQPGYSQRRDKVNKGPVLVFWLGTEVTAAMEACSRRVRSSSEPAIVARTLGYLKYED